MTVSRKREFVFDVGIYERHRIVYAYSKTWGGLVVTVSGLQLASSWDFMSGLSWTHRFVIGVQERHEVTIVKTRPLLLAAFRPHKCQAFVDGHFVAEALL